jgi:hypothetical protein
MLVLGVIPNKMRVQLLLMLMVSDLVITEMLLFSEFNQHLLGHKLTLFLSTTLLMV